MKRLGILFIMTLVLVGCGSKKKIVTKKKRNTSKTEQVVTETKKEETPLKTVTYANATEAYIANYNGIAKVEMQKYKIPASITLAQGILESGSGKGRLAVEANNHFGIKCHGWTGDKIYHDDDASQECFRKYNHANTSFATRNYFS